MGNNPSRNPFKRARLGLDAQQAVDEYKARSVWVAWWALDEAVRRRYFTKDERAFITRYGSRLDELATHRDGPKNEKEQHFVRVCMGDTEASTDRERLWLFVQLVCRFDSAASRSARADLAEHDAFALRAENRKLKSKNDHLESYIGALQRGERQLEDQPVDQMICNVVWATSLFELNEPMVGPPSMCAIVSTARRGLPLQTLLCSEPQ